MCCVLSEGTVWCAVCACGLCPVCYCISDPCDFSTFFYVSVATHVTVCDVSVTWQTNCTTMRHSLCKSIAKTILSIHSETTVCSAKESNNAVSESLFKSNMMFPLKVTRISYARLFLSGNLVYGHKMGTGIRLAALTKGRTSFVSFFSTTIAATNGRQHEKVCKELDNARLFQKVLFNHFVYEILTYIIPSFEFL